MWKVHPLCNGLAKLASFMFVFVLLVWGSNISIEENLQSANDPFFISFSGDEEFDDYYHIQHTVLNLAEQTKSASSLMIGGFIKAVPEELDRKRRQKGLTWTRFLQTEEQYSSEVAFTMANVFCETLYATLKHEAQQGVLKEADYKMLVVSGFSVFAVGLHVIGAASSDSIPSLIKLVQIAVDYDDKSILSVILDLFSDRPTSRILLELFDRTEFWFKVFLLEDLITFQLCPGHLTEAQLRKLLQMITKHKRKIIKKKQNYIRFLKKVLDGN